MKPLKPYILTLLILGISGQALHHWQWQGFRPDFVGEVFGILNATGIFLTALFLVEIGRDN